MKKSRLSSRTGVRSSTWARWAMCAAGACVSVYAAGERDAVEQLAGGADHARADDPRRGGGAVHDDVDEQMTGRVLDVDLGAVPGGQPAVSSCPTAPGSSIPVTTLTAASTPIEVCGCTGMNDRVLTLPPSRAGASSDRLGHRRAADTSPRPISWPALRRKASTRSSSGGVRGELARATRIRSGRTTSAIAMTTGMPLSTQVTSMPSIASRTWPVGSSAAGRRALGVGERRGPPRRRCRARRRWRRRRGTRRGRPGSGRWRPRCCRS